MVLRNFRNNWKWTEPEGWSWVCNLNLEDTEAYENEVVTLLTARFGFDSLLVKHEAYNIFREPLSGYAAVFIKSDLLPEMLKMKEIFLPKFLGVRDDDEID